MPVCSSIATARTCLKLHLTSLAPSCLPAMVGNTGRACTSTPIHEQLLGCLSGCCFLESVVSGQSRTFLVLYVPQQKGSPCPIMGSPMGTQSITLKQRDYIS